MKLTALSISDDDDVKPPAKKATISKTKPKTKVETKMDIDDSDDDCEFYEPSVYRLRIDRIAYLVAPTKVEIPTDSYNVHTTMDSDEEPIKPKTKAPAAKAKPKAKPTQDSDDEPIKPAKAKPTLKKKAPVMIESEDDSDDAVILPTKKATASKKPAAKSAKKEESDFDDADS